MRVPSVEAIRRTGRTARMLDEAKELARQGRAVYVVAATYAHAKNLEHIAGEECQQLGIKFETPDSLGNFDWRTMRLITGHPNCVVLADHFAIETHFAQMLEMLHRYDVPPTSVKSQEVVDEAKRMIGLMKRDA